MKGQKMKSLMWVALCLPGFAFAQDVNFESFVRAESDHMIRSNMASLDMSIGAFSHEREPTTAENQPVIRMNQDTLYSAAVLDLSEPVEITLPEVGGRYMSMHVISQDHFMFVETKPGTYRLTEEMVGTPFAFVAIRTFADVTDPADIEAAHKAQDGLVVTGGGPGPFVAPDWSQDDLTSMRSALNSIALLGFDTTYSFGRKGKTRPIPHLIGAAAGWGGLPRESAMYPLGEVAENNGTVPHSVTVGDVPVDAFWSITVYNADGYMEPNEMGVNSYNNFTAAPNDDGTITIHFGACEDGRLNCIPITPGWNSAIRLYEPREELLDGSWSFPAFTPAG